jgi:hypothetical protein
MAKNSAFHGAGVKKYQRILPHGDEWHIVVSRSTAPHQVVIRCILYFAFRGSTDLAKCLSCLILHCVFRGIEELFTTK